MTTDILDKEKKLQSLKLEYDNMIYPNYDEYLTTDFDTEISSGEILSSMQNEINILESEIYAEKYRTNKISSNKASIPNISDPILSDHTTIKDHFNRESCAMLLAKLICNSSKSPLNIGIFARWGEGKTTFLNFIEDKIKSNFPKKDFHIVKFNASEYEEKEKIWTNITKVLFKKYESESYFPKVKYLWSKMKHRKKEYLEPFLITSILLVIIAILISLLKNITLIKVFINLSLTIVGVFLSIPLFKYFSSTLLSTAKNFYTKFNFPNYHEELGKRESIIEDLNILFSAWIKPNKSKIILFVDELDRYSEKGIVEFFQSIQILSNVDNLIIIFAIDHVQLKNALKNEYHIDENELDDFSSRYLDKYIDFPISLKNEDNYGSYIDKLLSESQNNINIFSEEEQKNLKLLINKIPKTFLTPRKTKKLINMLYICKQYYIDIYISNDLNFSEYILWFIFSYFYKETAKNILSKFTDEKSFHPLRFFYSDINPNDIECSENTEGIVSLLYDIPMCDIVEFEKITSQITFFI